MLAAQKDDDTDPLKIPIMTDTKSFPYKYDGSRQYCVNTLFVNIAVCNQIGAANSVSSSFSLVSFLASPLRFSWMRPISVKTSFCCSEFRHSSFQSIRLPSLFLLLFAAVSRMNSATFLFLGQSTPRSAKYLMTSVPFSPTGPK